MYNNYTVVMHWKNKNKTEAGTSQDQSRIQGVVVIRRTKGMIRARAKKNTGVLNWLPVVTRGQHIHVYHHTWIIRISVLTCSINSVHIFLSLFFFCPPNLLKSHGRRTVSRMRPTEPESGGKIPIQQPTIQAQPIVSMCHLSVNSSCK